MSAADGDGIDNARAVRTGEELDLGKLTAYLDEQLGARGPVTVEQFPGGHSNLTYLVHHGEHEYVLRRPPFGSKVKSAHDMGREVRVLSALAPVYPLAPRPLAYCEDEAVLGARFYVMQRLRGVILRKEAPGVDPPTARRLCELLVDALVDLHAIDYRAAGLGDLGKPAGYVARQVSGWTERYDNSKTDDIPAVIEIAAWLAAHLPPDHPEAATLIHNDFKFDNVVLAPEAMDRIIGVLDWEMTTIGDPLMDLGTSLSYWVEASDPTAMQVLRFGPTAIPGMMTRAEVVARYGERSGRDVAGILFYYVYGLFKTAVVAQQIYYRFAKGLTADPRFGAFIHGVRALADQGRAAIERGTV